jgi:hypothetical protein
MNEAKLRTKELLENLDGMLTDFHEKADKGILKFTETEGKLEKKIGATLRWINTNLDKETVLKIGRESLIENYDAMKYLLNQVEYDPKRYH